jgi:hypothetical protein
MPLQEVKDRLEATGGSLSCKKTSEPLLRECTGSMRDPRTKRFFEVLIASIRDSAAVIVLTAGVSESEGTLWVRWLSDEFGTPNREHQPSIQQSWQWIRRGQMLRVVTREAQHQVRASVTLTDGPLLDGLGSPKQ